MNKACIISAYFGEFPNIFAGWLISVKHNTDFDFLLVTDQDVELEVAPSNLRVVNMSLSQMRELARKKLGIGELVLNTPYKCCDYKPVYGIIFEDYLRGYEFVGNCDLDMIFGDLGYFITEDIWNNYDKILPLGHLAFYRNTREVLEYYKLEGKVYADYKKAFTTEEICVFDEEVGINNIYRDNGLRLYDKYIMADISERNFRMKLTKMSIDKNKDYRNYNYQIFVYDKGKIFRYYIDDEGMMGRDEFVYLHAKKRNILADKLEMEESFYILSDSLKAKGNVEITEEIIKNYCGFVSLEYEKKELKKHNTKVRIKSGVRKCKRVVKRLLQ